MIAMMTIAMMMAIMIRRRWFKTGSSSTNGHQVLAGHGVQPIVALGRWVEPVPTQALCTARLPLL
jgi:hypothetical protein